MGSINAEKTALEVSETIRKGGKVNLGKIIKKRYSESTSKSPSLVTNTKSYQKVITPITEEIAKEIKRLQKAIKAKTLDSEEYKVLTDALDKQIKNYQLLSGNETERIGVFKLEDLFKANAKE